MPKFTLPARKKPKKDKTMAAMPMDDYRRHVSIPANNEILGALDIGDKVTITLEAKVSELSKHESADYKDMHFGVEVMSVEAYPTTKDKEEKDFQKGYKKAGMDK